jgi:hypothetical protein
VTSGLVQDPTDSSKWIIQHAAESVWGTQLRGPIIIHNVHSADKCAGQPCVMHNPSQHHMVDWPCNWRDDIQLMERLCQHNVGHPDPDCVAYITQMLGEAVIHGCCADGCCRPR